MFSKQVRFSAIFSLYRFTVFAVQCSVLTGVQISLLCIDHHS